MPGRPAARAPSARAPDVSWRHSDALCVASVRGGSIDVGREEAARMRSTPTTAVYVLVMVAVIVGLDLTFFRDGEWVWERLASNVGIVLVFGAFYFRFLAP